MQTARRRRTRVKHSSTSSSRRPALSSAFRDSTLTETAVLVGIVVAVAFFLWIYQSFITSFESSDKGGGGNAGRDSSIQVIAEPPLPSKTAGHLRNLSNNNNNLPRQTLPAGGYDHFSKIAQDLAELNPTETLETLERDDPFGTRHFDMLLLQQETELGRVLTIQELQQLFPCPENEQRITLPDARVEQKAKSFRDGKKGTFLFFQHLRKVSSLE